jgi:L-asparaginase
VPTFRTIISLVAAGFLASSAVPAQQQVKPGVVIFATGGTIAGTAKSSIDTTTYRSSTLGVQRLIDAVPEIQEVATVTGEQIANVGSPDVDQTILLRLAQAINRSLADPGVHGVVVTHGTDTLEETAFFLDLTTAGTKPVVIVGAMRPATAISADGPMNLLQAITLAASSDAEKRGAMIVLNDRIGSAFYTTKTNTTSLDAFRAADQGYLGMFIGTKPRFYYSSAMPRGRLTFQVNGIKSFPKVPIIYSYEDQDTDQIDAAIRAGAKGIVIAGSGNGATPLSVRKRITELTSQGFPVVLSTRTGSGFSTRSVEGIASGVFNPQKSRILLMLALAQGADVPTIRTYFSE